MVKSYSELKDELFKIINDVSTLFSLQHSKISFEHLKEKLLENIFNIVVMGQFKRGKTSLINALIGNDLLPVAVVPLTSIATILTYGENLKITVCFNNEECKEIPIEELGDYVTEKGNPKNIKGVSEVYITYPSSYLKDGVRLIDTPGVGSVYQHNTDVAYQYLPKCDAVFFLVSVDQPMSKNELDFLNDVKEYSGKIFFLLNKKDYLSESELKESIEFIKSILSEIYQSPKIYPVSAKLALTGIKTSDDKLIEESGIKEFLTDLNKFLMEEKGNVLINAISNNILKVLQQLELEIDLELKSLKTPLNDLQEKIRLFENKKVDILQKKDDFEILLEGEIKKLIKNILEEDIDKQKKSLISHLDEVINKTYNENKNISLRELYKIIESKIIDEIRFSFDKWIPQEDDKLYKNFQRICKRFVSDVDAIIDEIVSFASELFGEKMSFVKTELLWETKSDFYYKFKRETLMIDALSASITLSLPKIIGDKILLKNFKSYITSAVDMQAGNLRYDFAERLNKSKIKFKWEMVDKISATIDGIEKAIKKGLESKNKSEVEINKRETELISIREKITEYKSRLHSFQNSTSQV